MLPTTNHSLQNVTDPNEIFYSHFIELLDYHERDSNDEDFLIEALTIDNKEAEVEKLSIEHIALLCSKILSLKHESTDKFRLLFNLVQLMNKNQIEQILPHKHTLSWFILLYKNSIFKQEVFLKELSQLLAQDTITYENLSVMETMLSYIPSEIINSEDIDEENQRTYRVFLGLKVAILTHGPKLDFTLPEMQIPSLREVKQKLATLFPLKPIENELIRQLQEFKPKESIILGVGLFKQENKAEAVRKFIANFEAINQIEGKINSHDRLSREDKTILKNGQLRKIIENLLMPYASELKNSITSDYVSYNNGVLDQLLEKMSKIAINERQENTQQVRITR